MASQERTRNSQREFDFTVLYFYVFKKF
uniref:Uncharacterized protein n=1 Tax=Rhizophora mucronata TaxID=61149 RepID=A0A2P2JFP5_RHIMU